IPALDVGLNLLAPQRLTRRAQLLHLHPLVRTNVDAAKHGDVNRHRFNSSSLERWAVSCERACAEAHSKLTARSSSFSYGYETFPSTAARFAPVADGTFDGRRFQVSNANTAKATASLASDGIPNSSDKCSVMPSSRISFASQAIKVGLRVPPPETMISEKFAFGKTKR